MQIKNHRDVYCHYPKQLLASCFSNTIPLNLKESLQTNILPLEVFANHPKDYRMSNRGTGRVHEIVDPSLNCFENSWIATKFQLTSEGAKINGDINNIDRNLHPALYGDIEKLFNEMLPMMSSLRDLSKYEALNVIVKIQSSQLKSGETAEGKFHQEGFKSEGIFMVALYYFSISKEIKGGNLELQFVKDKKFNKELGCMNYEMEKSSFDVQEGDALVFLNRYCDHRITKLEAISTNSDSFVERKVLAFFIADPSKSTIPNSMNLKINKKLDVNEKDFSYVRRNNFLKALVLSDIEKELDYNDEEEPNTNEVVSDKIEKRDEDSFQVILGADNGELHTIECKSSDTLRDLMAKCQMISKTNELTNIFHFKDQSFKGGNTTLAECGISGKKNSKITLFSRSSRNVVM